MNLQLRTSSEASTIRAGRELAAALRGGVIIALEGPLGAGKTCLARGIAIGLGVEARRVASPTFAILHEHEVEGVGEVRRLYHLDAYRLGGAEDLESIGWTEIVGDQTGVVLIEWASRIAEALPAGAWRMDVSYDDSTGRLLQLQLPVGVELEMPWGETEDSATGG